jgi:hypothetical protein
MGTSAAVGLSSLVGDRAEAKPAAAKPAAAKPPARPSAKPPKPDDAGTPPLESAQDAASGDSGAASTGTSAGAGGASGAVRADIGDGGIKSSPLNPAVNEFPAALGQDGGAVPLDYDRMLSDIAALRARVAAAGDALFKSRLAIAVKLTGKHARIGRLSIALDDGTVYVAPTGFRPEDFTSVYDHALAAGRHAITVDIERRDDRDESFRSSQRSRFTVEVPKEQRLELEVHLIDESDMGGDFPSDRSGDYDLRVKFKAVAKAAGK